MKEKLNELIKSCELAELHLYQNAEGKFSCGIIIACDEKYFAFQSYGPYGDYDGYQVNEIRDAIEIVTDTKYLKALEILIGDNRREPIKVESDNLIKEFLRLSIENEKLVLLDITNHDDMQYAFVTAVNDNSVQLRIINEYGVPDGSATVFINDIFQIEYDSRNTRKIEKLYSARQ